MDTININMDLKRDINIDIINIYINIDFMNINIQLSS